ncbi:succinate dehydrogenase cytochrome b subunit [Janibacter sp. GXQ6167]|uniref:succinate dehydrogenase cytochrome b subunit n=1 Tax=Janibacter sp. GXQ6167 TaxID=3240791 RepID=UPI0035237620
MTSSSIGLKILMAVTGILFVLFVLAHMYGNLKVLAGEEAFNTYAHHLRTFGEPMLPYEGLLWGLRIVLILALIGHAYSAFTLWSRAQGARSQKYAVKKAIGSTLASRTMRWGGVALLLFLIFHLIHFTIVKPSVNSNYPADQIAGNPFLMVVGSFELWWMVLLYALAMVALGMHLYHGVWSASQTLGWTSSAKSRGVAKTTAHVVAAVVVVGFLIPPFAILFGIVKG